MSDQSKPKGPPGAPVEGRTQAFRVKIDGWMSELMSDFDLDPKPPEEAPAGAPVEGEPGEAPRKD